MIPENNMKTFIYNNKKIFLTTLWVTLFIFAFLFLGFRIGHESIWYDESHTWAVVNHGFADIMNILKGDSHPPLYFIMLKIFTLMSGESLAALRYFSMAGTLALMSLGFGPLRRITGNTGGFIFSLLTAVVPVFSSFSQEARMYTWACFFVTASLCYGYLILSENKISDWIKFTAFTLASAYTHNYALLAVFFLNVFMFVYFLMKDRKKIFPMIISGSISVLLYMPWLLTMLVQVKNASNDFWIPKVSLYYTVKTISLMFENKFYSYDSFLSLIGTAAVIVIIYFGAVLTLKEKKINIMVLSLAVYFSVFIFTLIFSIFIKPIFYPRYFVTVLGALLIAVSWTLARTGSMKTAAVAVAVITLLSIPQNVFLRVNRINGPMHEVSEYLKTRVGRNDIFIHGDEHTLGTFMYYFPHNRQYLYAPDGEFSDHESTFGKNTTVFKNFDEIKTDLGSTTGNVWTACEGYSYAGLSVNVLSRRKFREDFRPDSKAVDFKINASWFKIRLEHYTGDRSKSKIKPAVYDQIIAVNDRGTELEKDWWKKAVFYECFVRAFKDSDGDGYGDFKGLTDKLDYLKNLGITALWLLPVMKSQDRDHGYETVDYRQVEKDYGTMDDFENLLKEAHRRNIAVIIDFVANHTAYMHPFFQDSLKDRNCAYREWYVWSFENPLDFLPNAIENPWRKEKSGYYYAFFSKDMPDLNYRNESVKNYTGDNVKFWLNEGVDGFRFDAAALLVENEKVEGWHDQKETHRYFQYLRTIIEKYKNKFTVCEAVTNPYDQRISNDYLSVKPQEFHSSFAFGFQNIMINAVKTGNPSKIDRGLKDIILRAPNGTMYSTFLANHDFIFGTRVSTQLGNDPQKCKLSCSLLLTLPGIPFIYYGEEIGMEQDKRLEDWESTRTPMQWNNGRNAGFTNGRPFRMINNNYLNKNVEAESNDPDSLLNHFRKMIGIRKSRPAFSTGGYEKINTNDDSKFYAFSRSDEKGIVIVVLNFTNRLCDVSLNMKGVHFSIKKYKAGSDLFTGESADSSIIYSSKKLLVKDVKPYGIRIIPFDKK